MPTRYIFDTDEAVRHLSQFPTLALDIETTGVNVHIDRAAVVSIAGPDHVAAVLHYPRAEDKICLLYTSPSPRDRTRSRMPSSA